jgi:uncharacterized iron-regulated membrane protein
MIRAMIGSTLRRAVCGFALALTALALPAAHARDSFFPRIEGAGNDYAPRSAQQDRRISLSQAVDRVQRATGGRVLDARESGDGYRIKVLTRRGEVIVVYVDGRTGEMR